MRVRTGLAALAMGLVVATSGGAVQAARATLPGQTPEDIQHMVVEEAARAGLSPELALAVAKVESGFNAAALSSAGARGVMQIMPATARGEFGVGADLLWSPAVNIRLGVAYLKGLLDYYGREEFALSHYNGGSRVGPPPYSQVIPETRDYVNAVLSWKQRFESQGGARVILANLGTITPRQLAPGKVAARQVAVRQETSRPQPVRRTASSSSTGGWVSVGDWNGGAVRGSGIDRW